MTSINARGQQPTTINITSYPAGTYIVEFVSGEVALRTKLIKVD